MCDYSLHAVATRPARVGETLVVAKPLLAQLEVEADGVELMALRRMIPAKVLPPEMAARVGTSTDRKSTRLNSSH